MNTIEITDIEGATHEQLKNLDLVKVTERVNAYCSSPNSGFQVYDLAAQALRATDTFDHVSPWAMNWGNLLNGNVSIKNIADFTIERRQEFGWLIQQVSEHKDLPHMIDSEVEAVVQLCSFGYPGVWAAKTTKVAALYRPQSVPVLDGQIAIALGFARDDFAVKPAAGSLWSRRDKIRNTIYCLRHMLNLNQEQLRAVRNHVQSYNPSISAISDLRLLDIILWTSQDSRSRTLRGLKDPWTLNPKSSLPSAINMETVSIPR